MLDQFEQFSLEAATHRPLFEALKGVVRSGMPPYRLTWVVAFRHDYDPSWRDFELSITGFHPPMVSLRLWGPFTKRKISYAKGSKFRRASYNRITEYAANEPG